ncbi:Transferase [Sesbania bispinosa]|nr:Transferase [Sesbania bispinosa]
MTVSYSGHQIPLAAVQVTELADGVFVGCTVNHSVTDGTSFWHFFNTFAAAAKSGGAKKITKSPDFTRDTVFNSESVLPVPAGGPAVTFDVDAPLRERVFHFSREAIQKLKQRANGNGNGIPDFAEVIGKQLWRSVTRARKLDPSKTSTFRMAVNCRHRLEPRMDPFYFGNAIQSIPTVATAADIVSRDLRFCAELLHQNVVAHDDATVRRGIQDWEEKAPRLFPLGNFDGAMITMGSSPRFPMYDNDFGWGRPLAIRSGKANKFDGKISAFPGREGNG